MGMENKKHWQIISNLLDLHLQGITDLTSIILCNISEYIIHRHLFVRNQSLFFSIRQTFEVFHDIRITSKKEGSIQWRGKLNQFVVFPLFFRCEFAQYTCTQRQIAMLNVSVGQ